MSGKLPFRISGIYPHLAVSNNGLTECGIGAIIYQNNKLYFITYPASGARGDDNKLYSVDENMQLMVYPESVGGTHANRFYHAESQQWIIGTYFISNDDNVRTLDPHEFVGRLTGVGRHISDPEQFVYINTMEDGLYEVNVATLEYRRLRRDRFGDLSQENMRLAAAPDKLWGDHGKGGYGAQGVFVLSNNGHGGVLAEWNGKKDAQKRENWRIVDREKYTEITSPGDVKGPVDAGAPIWALGWDTRSVLLNVRTLDGTWTRFRLPKASYTQDADHGWYTEWPRIREVHGIQLMCMHGMLYEFPYSFTPRQTTGIRPIARHLKMIADWVEWKDEIAFACDDASVFGNPILGRPQSNLWFSSLSALQEQSVPEGWGGVYLRDNVSVGEPSEPFFIGGFDFAILHIMHEEGATVRYQIEEDRDGSGIWVQVGSIVVDPYSESDPAIGYAFCDIRSMVKGDWVRLIPCADATNATAYFYLSCKARTQVDTKLVHGLHGIHSNKPFSMGLVRPMADASLRLEYQSGENYFVLDETLMRQTGKIDSCAALSSCAYVQKGSVLVIDSRGRRWRLPKACDAYDTIQDRQLREVVTERSLLNICGTIYEVPREPSGEYMRMKPITTHKLRIHDFCSYRGMLVLSGVDDEADSEHIVRGDGAALWVGNVDDLWKFGKPEGYGILCDDEERLPGEASDPLLMAGYDHKQVELCADKQVRVCVEVDISASGTWGRYAQFELIPGKTVLHVFPEGYNAHWVRVRTDTKCKLTAKFVYS